MIPSCLGLLDLIQQGNTRGRAVQGVGAVGVLMGQGLLGKQSGVRSGRMMGRVKRHWWIWCAFVERVVWRL